MIIYVNARVVNHTPYPTPSKKNPWQPHHVAQLAPIIITFRLPSGCQAQNRQKKQDKDPPPLQGPPAKIVSWQRASHFQW